MRSADGEVSAAVVVVEAEAAAKCAACHRPGVIDPTSAAPRRQAGRQAEGKTGKVAAVEPGRGGGGGVAAGREHRGVWGGQWWGARYSGLDEMGWVWRNILEPPYPPSIHIISAG